MNPFNFKSTFLFSVQRKRLPFKNQRAVIKVENKIKLEDTTTNSHKSSFSSTDGSTNSESNRNRYD